MGAADEQRPAVRIELGDDEGATVAPPAEPGTRGGNRAMTFGILVFGVLLVTAMVWATRPNDGETAARTPIVSPTVPPVESEPSAAAEDEEFPSTSTTTSVDVNAYESVAADIYFFAIVEADLGWVALGFSPSSRAPELFRSVDGLRWSAFPEASLPDGDVLGLDRIDGTYLIAVDEAGTWSETTFDFETTGVYPDHEVSVWTSTDAVSWERSELPVLEGNGFPYFATFTRDSFVVPIIDAPEDPHRALVDYLAPFVDADVAAQVCQSRMTFETDVRTVRLEDCGGRMLAEVTEAEFPDDFDKVRSEHCIDIARSVGSQRFRPVVVNSDGVTYVELSWSGGSLFGQAVPGGYLTRSTADRIGLPQECGGDPISLVPTGDELRFWSEATGEVGVSPTAGIGQGGASPFGIIRGPDDRYYVTVGRSVWAGSPPFDEWEEVLTSPVEGDALLMLSSNGTHAFVDARDRVYLARTNGDWTSIPITDPFGYTELVVATDEYAVIREQGDGGSRFVKVPLS